MSDIKCYFHPERNAVEKCEECGKFVCVECKYNFKKKHTHRTGKTSSVYYTHHELCPQCYANAIESDGNSMKAALPCFGYIIFLMFGIAAMTAITRTQSEWGYFSEFARQQDRIFLGIFTTILVIAGLSTIGNLIYSVLVKGPQATEKANKIRSKVKNLLEAKINYKLKKKTSTRDSKVSQFTLNCPFCGAPTRIGQNTCKFCGQTWIWK